MGASSIPNGGHANIATEQERSKIGKTMTNDREAKSARMEKLSDQIKAAIEHLPEHLQPHELEALVMTIAQLYAPNLKTAVAILIQAGITLKEFIDIVEEAGTATKN
jgi:hypothetical protein